MCRFPYSLPVNFWEDCCRNVALTDFHVEQILCMSAQLHCSEVHHSVMLSVASLRSLHLGGDEDDDVLAGNVELGTMWFEVAWPLSEDEKDDFQ